MLPIFIASGATRTCPLTTWVGRAKGRGYAANMGSRAAAELSQLVESGIEQAVGALRRAVTGGLDVGELTNLLGVAFTQRTFPPCSSSIEKGSL